MAPIIIDLEASGFGRGSYPIEAGFALADGQCHCSIIKPQSDWQHWDQKAEGLHGISRDTLISHGKTVVEVADMLNEFLAGETVYSDAWGNDRSWLALLFDRASTLQAFTLESLHSLLNEQQLALWHDTKEQVIVETGFTRHRASSDALILQRTYEQTLRLSQSNMVNILSAKQARK